MKYMTINNQKVAFDKEKNVLEVIRSAGIEIPTFCFHSELSTYGACRMCIVEDERGSIFASCSETPRDGMVIYTNTPRLQHHRKMILELLLASHDRECTTCHFSMDCRLQELARQLGVNYIRFDNYKEKKPIDLSSPSIVIDPNKCILCGDCIRTCDEIQGMGILEFVHRGSKMEVSPAFGRSLSETECVGCGQCALICPTGAITVNQNIHPVWEVLSDKNTRVVAQIAPAVRVAIGDKFGFGQGENCIGKLAAALRRMGFDAVYDTNFAADLTVTEEAAEFVDRLTKNENLPLFTSCCPGWVKFCEEKHPALAGHISTCRSPQGMFSAVLKDEAKTKNDGKKLVVVGIMPCTAKKGEILRPDYKTDGVQDTDYVLTTTEITRMITEAGINFRNLPDEALDMPYGLHSGAGAIFGVTGGVTEAVIRNLAGSHDLQNLKDISLMGFRGMEEIKEASLTLDGRELRIAVVNTLSAADKVMTAIEKGEVYYDFVEVMACKRGCVGGGGQPAPMHRYVRRHRLEGVYKIDEGTQIKRSADNPIVQVVYSNIAGKEHKLLHRAGIGEHAHEGEKPDCVFYNAAPCSGH